MTFYSVFDKNYVINHVAVGDTEGVYSDLNIESKDKVGIGAWGFEPQTPTVSR